MLNLGRGDEKMGFLGKLLGGISGAGGLQISEQLLFDKVIGFRNIVPGCGCSTIVQNVAIALTEKTNYNVCILDVNCLYPMQYAFFVNSVEDPKGPDIFDFDASVSDVSVMTRYGSIYVVGFNNRTVIDMMSSKDTSALAEKLIGSLKTFFDIILVDLSGEFSNISVQAGICCNKIYNVCDTSMRSIYHLKKSLNTMATLAVPLIKANKVILNRQLKDISVDIKGALDLAGLTMIASIPFSEEIAKLGVSGGRLYGTFSGNPDLTAFSAAIDIILNDMLAKTPLNLKFMKGMENAVPKKDSVSISKQDSTSTVSSEDETFEVVNTPDASDIVEDVEVIK